MRNTISRTVAATLGLGLTLSMAGPVAARDRIPSTTAAATVEAADVRPTDVRPVRERDVERPKREVLQLSCKAVDRDDEGRTHVGCRWRAATGDQAVGYQLWRIVDRGDRMLVARGGLDMLGARDVVPAGATVVRYAVLALNEDGRVVGQSRVQKLELGDDGGPTRTDHSPVRAGAWARSVR